MCCFFDWLICDCNPACCTSVATFLMNGAPVNSVEHTHMMLVWLDSSAAYNAFSQQAVEALYFNLLIIYNMFA